MLKIIPLGSGSSGNSWLMLNGKSAIMIDAGFSNRKLTERMQSADLDPAMVEAVFITHDHSDHTAGLGPFSRKYNPLVYISDKTWNRIERRAGKISRRLGMAPGETVLIHGFSVTAIPVPHDSAEPFIYSVSSNGIRVTIATDLGKPTNLVRHYLSRSDVVVIEANHDPNMLMNGPYPWNLKQRIRGKHGHLSNEDAAALLAEIAPGRLRGIYLAHLSEQNNEPELALKTVAAALEAEGAGNIPILIANQHHSGPPLVLDKNEAPPETGTYEKRTAAAGAEEK